MDIMLVNVPEENRVEKMGELGTWCKRWVPGESLPSEETRHHDRVPGFKARGWRCESLRVGDGAGFRAVRGS